MKKQILKKNKIYSKNNKKFTLDKIFFVNLIIFKTNAIYEQ